MHLQCTESQLRCHTSRTRHCVSPRSSHCGLAAQTGGPPPVIASWRRLCLPAAGDVTVVDRGQNDQSPAESFPSYAPGSALFQSRVVHLQCTESQLRCHTSRTRHCVSPRSSHCGLAAQTGGPPPVIASWRRLCLPAAGDVTVVDRGQNDQSPAESFPSYAPGSALFLPPTWRTLCPSFYSQRYSDGLH